MTFKLRNFLFPILILGGCSSKPSYTPELKHYQDRQLHFIYQRGKYIDRIEFHRAIFSTGEIDNFGNSSETSSKLFPDEVVESRRDNLVAFVKESNSIGLFDLEKNSTIFQYKFTTVATIDRRLPPPKFEGENILYFTLDGKVAIFSIPRLRIVKVFSIGTGEDYPNVVDYQLRPNDLTLITHRKAMVIGDGFDEEVKLNLRGAIFESEAIYLITKDGEVRKYSRKLQLEKKIKFPFAYFVTWGEVGNKIYLIESQGYIIELDRDLENYRVIPAPELEDINCYINSKKLVCDERFLRLPLQ